MLNVSEQFLVATKDTVRQVKGKVDIVWTEPSIDPSISHVVNDENRAANMKQTYDNTSEMSQKWAHLDGVIKADGTYHPMPNPASSSSGGQVGWYGVTDCDGSGHWGTNPTLQIFFNSRPILSLLVAGDDVYGEYPVDFKITLFDGLTLEHTEIVTGNDQVLWMKNIVNLNLNTISKMTLNISKWSTPGRVVKIAEFYSSFIQTFNGDEIVSMNLLEERVIGDGSLPVGNISANEIDLVLQNIRINVDGSEEIDPFFPANPNSPYNQVLIKNRKITPYIGFVLGDDSIEYVKLGTYWTSDWSVNEQNPNASVSARDRMELLRKAEYKGSVLYEDTTLYDLVSYVLTDARNTIPMPDLQWQTDVELQNYTIKYAWFPKSSYFKAIKTIVEACMGQAYMSREDVLIIEGPSALTT